MTAPDTAHRLLTALERTGPHPVLAWYGEDSRIELSGHVLANWLIKAIGHLDGEIALEPEEPMVLELPAHWKRLVLALAGWALGAEVTVAEGTGDTALADGDPPRVVVTDRPASARAAAADEVLALEPVSLGPRFTGELPPLAHDWAQEVRASPDHLGVALPGWSGPAPAPAPTPTPAPAPTPTPTPTDGAGDGADAAGHRLPRLLVDGDGLGDLPAVLAALLAGGGIVAPAASVTPRQAAEEGVTSRA